MSGYMARTFRCCCGHDHELVDDNDVWYDQDNRLIGRTACLLAAGLITPEQAAQDD